MNKIVYNLPLKIIFIDWDDTLFLTTELLNMAILYKTDVFNLNITKELNQKLNNLENHVYNLLLFLKDIGNLYIITNATKSWVYKSCLYFMPNIYNFIKTINIVSAYDEFNNNFALENTNGEDWKYYTMLNISNMYINKNIQLISIGDSNYEKNAVIKLQNSFNLNILILKLKEFPTIDILIYQFIYVINNLKTLQANNIYYL